MSAYLSRREFGVAISAAVVASLALASPAGALRDGARYVHAEIGAGPWRRNDLAALAARIAIVTRLGAPVGASALGAAADAEAFPGEFVLTLHYTDGARLVLRASGAHAGPAHVIVRGADGAREFRVDAVR